MSTVPSRQTKATSSIDGSNHQAAISRRLLGQHREVVAVAVTDTALGTRTHSHGIPSLGMLQSIYQGDDASGQVYPISRICTSRDARATRHARGIWPAPGNMSDFSISFGLRRCVQAVDTPSPAQMVLSSSIIAVGT